MNFALSLRAAGTGDITDATRRLAVLQKLAHRLDLVVTEAAAGITEDHPRPDSPGHLATSRSQGRQEGERHA